MRRDTDRPIAALERLCRDAKQTQAFTEQVAEFLSARTGADARVFLALDPLSSLWTTGFQAGHPDESCRIHREHAFLRSPLADYAHASRRDERVVRVNAREVDRSDAYVHHCMLGGGFSDELHISFAHGRVGFGHLTLSRRVGRFDEAAHRLAEAAVAPVTNALRRLLATDLVASVPADHVALLVVDREGRITPANTAGEELIRNQSAQRDLYVSPISVVAELARRRMHDPAALEPPRVTFVDEATRRRYRIVCEPLLPGIAEARALLMVEPIRSLDSVELLRTAGLTERESEVALATLRGFRSAEGADALAISEHTFLSHLKATYRKLGVSSRAELASLLLGAA